MVDWEDAMRVVVSGGLSAVVFMAFWVGWLKTQKVAYRNCAFGIGLLPISFSVLVILARLIFASGTVHQFEAMVAGPGVREVVLPVEDAELRHVVEVRPALVEIGLEDPNGERVVLQRSEHDGMVEMEFEARRGGKYRLLLTLPEGVAKVGVVAREIR